MRNVGAGAGFFPNGARRDGTMALLRDPASRAAELERAERIFAMEQRLTPEEASLFMAEKRAALDTGPGRHARAVSDRWLLMLANGEVGQQSSPADPFSGPCR
jgi:hypothetical protein